MFTLLNEYSWLEDWGYNWVVKRLPGMCEAHGVPSPASQTHTKVTKNYSWLWFDSVIGWISFIIRHIIIYIKHTYIYIYISSYNYTSFSVVLWTKPKVLRLAFKCSVPPCPKVHLVTLLNFFL
jgi:hypothetical protein